MRERRWLQPGQGQDNGSAGVFLVSFLVFEAFFFCLFLGEAWRFLELVA
jgi:hypothetical protein